MSTTVLDALRNAQINFETLGNMGLRNNPIYLITKEQLDNALEAINNGKALDDIIQEHMFDEVKTK